MRQKIILLQEGKKIFQFSMKPAKRSVLGDFDIMIESSKKTAFDHVILGNYYKHYQKPEYQIKNISWHGYYEKINSKEVTSPVVHVKNQGQKIGIIRHLGSINPNEPFAFPVCSLYIPKDFPIDDLGRTEKNEENIYIDMDNYKENKNLRIDFFVLPKKLTIHEFKKSEIMLQYQFSDLEIFNTSEGEHNIVLEAEMNYFEHIENNKIFVRVVTDTSNLDYLKKGKKVFDAESNEYTLIINDPNDLYNKLTSYLMITVEDNKLSELTTLKKLHEKAIEFKKNDNDQ